MPWKYAIGDRVKVTKSDIEGMVGEVGTIRMELPDHLWWVKLDNPRFFQQYFYDEKITTLEYYEKRRK